jgi:hypothetical protein
VVNHTGIIEAQTVLQKDGKIILSSGGPGTTGLSGTLDASHVSVDADVVAVAAKDSLSTNNGNLKIAANDLDVKGDLDAGTGDVSFTRADGSDLDIKAGNNPGGGIGSNDIANITTKILTLTTKGDISVKGLKATDTDRIKDYVKLESGGNITFETVASVFRAVMLSAANDINMNVDTTTTIGDFIAVADSDVDGKGNFNVTPGVTVTSARDIDVTASTIDAEDSSFNETRDLILNGGRPIDNPEPPLSEIENESIVQGSLGTFLTEFFQNGGPGGC